MNVSENFVTARFYVLPGEVLSVQLLAVVWTGGVRCVLPTGIFPSATAF